MKRNGTKRRWNDVFAERILRCSEFAAHSSERLEQQPDVDRTTVDEPAGDGYPRATSDSSTTLARVDTLRVASLSIDSTGRYKACKTAWLACKHEQVVASTLSIRVRDLFEGRTAQTLH